ncbi:MAG: radical SAM protein [Candidatus Schekmanbacteria bacterium RIFCSPHIGHO2_02_FULL_38_11]|uniref:Radical SAM protein n=1 Tax=Candidatus Schekmanbacteria bacterium RIFCSPLOWO2_12_FULL_38_15 TaxID=1817883 RepID=A0A1F7SC68_9BACT|nr:MAG: radical SAM protein [Candidatus Schekmanbacteria bacterium RIFCSPHIGHO2_02_FULL_38_11]OGL49310.1 MAG: radical SAM protein [Candidatus Schekmanbacteria bacterium RIFCSPLOWO2_02_FULL_38_14]OGL51370.1 MAG: radical SAM protein [Candidatus Schekmanbacteria bacterium RIFCSPLOWO2_12_FULL_38_15]
MIIDSHAHLEMPQFREDLREVLDRASEAGVSFIITTGSTLQSCYDAVSLCNDERVYAAVGIHPHDTSTINQNTYREIESLCRNRKVVAIGEIGLDFTKKYSPADIQKKEFINQLRLAKRLNLPVIVHDREAHDDIRRILEDETSGLNGVIHCFSGNLEFAKEVLNFGFYIGIGGTITYPNAKALREVAKIIPVEKILVETDCPYLAPQLYRGKRNEPSFLPLVVKEIARIKGLSFGDVARITSLNANTIFNLIESPPKPEIAYRIRNSLYLNVTSRCTNECIFCERNNYPIVKGHYLKLNTEPSEEELISSIGNPVKYDEIVFCGYGEPLLKLETVKNVSKWIKEKGGKVRINTNGQGNLIHKRNIIPELKGLVDSISVSLNAETGEKYHTLCHSMFGPKAYEEIIKFVRECKNHIPSVTVSIVGMRDVNVDECKKIADELGVGFRVREYNEVG